MDDLRIQSLITELDRLVPRDNALVQIIQHGGGPDESYAVGNHTGYLRLGIEFMRAAYAPLRHGGRDVAVDFSYVLDSDADVLLNWLERSEDVGRGRLESEHIPRRDQVVRMAFAAGFFLLAICAIIGVVTIGHWVLP